MSSARDEKPTAKTIEVKWNALKEAISNYQKDRQKDAEKEHASQKEASEKKVPQIGSQYDMSALTGLCVGYGDKNESADLEALMNETNKAELDNKILLYPKDKQALITWYKENATLAEREKDNIIVVPELEAKDGVKIIPEWLADRAENHFRKNPDWMNIYKRYIAFHDDNEDPERVKMIGQLHSADKKMFLSHYKNAEKEGISEEKIKQHFINETVDMLTFVSHKQKDADCLQVLALFYRHKKTSQLMNHAISSMHLMGFDKTKSTLIKAGYFPKKLKLEAMPLPTIVQPVQNVVPFVPQEQQYQQYNAIYHAIDECKQYTLQHFKDEGLTAEKTADLLIALTAKQQRVPRPGSGSGNSREPSPYVSSDESQSPEQRSPSLRPQATPSVANQIKKQRQTEGFLGGSPCKNQDTQQQKTLSDSQGSPFLPMETAPSTLNNRVGS